MKGTGHGTGTIQEVELGNRLARERDRAWKKKFIRALRKKSGPAWDQIQMREKMEPGWLAKVKEMVGVSE